MLKRFRPRSVYDVMAALSLFLVLAGGTAYAAATITGADVVNESLTGTDVKGMGGSATAPAVNGSLTGVDLEGQAPNPANGTPFIDGTVTQWDIRNSAIGTDDVANNSLTGADIDEGSLVGGPGSPSGAAGGDLTGSYPNPRVQDRAIGARHLKSLLEAVHDSAVIPPGGTTGSAGNEPDVRAVCPAGTFALTGGGYWDFNSGQISGIRHFQSAVLVNGTNRGTAEQTLHAFAYCLPN